MQGYTDGAYDTKQFYSIQDLRGPLPTCVANPGSIFHELINNETTTKFGSIVRDCPQLMGIFNDPTAAFTVFVPINSGIPDVVAQIADYDKQLLINQHTLSKALPWVFIQGSGGMLVDTRATGNQLFVRTEPGTTSTIVAGAGPGNRFWQGGHANVVGYKNLGRSLLVAIDRVLPLSLNPLSHE